MTDDQRELALYLANRKAFWLFPDRWEGYEAGGCMAFDDGSWRPPEPTDAAAPCRRCLLFACRCAERETRAIQSTIAEQSRVDWAMPVPTHGPPWPGLRCALGVHRWVAGRDALGRTAHACLRCAARGSGPSDLADRVRLLDDLALRMRARAAGVPHDRVHELWIDPTDVLVKGGHDCGVCGCPGWTCVDYATCPRAG